MLGKPLRHFICGESYIVTFKYLELHHQNGPCTIYDTSSSFVSNSTFIYECQVSHYGISYVGNHISLHLNISSCTIQMVHLRYMRLIYKPTLIRKTFISYFVVMLLCRLYIRGEAYTQFM